MKTEAWAKKWTDNLTMLCTFPFISCYTKMAVTNIIVIQGTWDNPETASQISNMQKHNIWTYTLAASLIRPVGDTRVCCSRCLSFCKYLLKYWMAFFTVFVLSTMHSENLLRPFTPGLYHHHHHKRRVIQRRLLSNLLFFVPNGRFTGLIIRAQRYLTRGYCQILLSHTNVLALIKKIKFRGNIELSYTDKLY